jgi:hypothetical protein
MERTTDDGERHYWKTREAGYELKDGESFDTNGHVRPVPGGVPNSPEDSE